MKILLVNGPNMARLGKREPGIYGTQSLAEIVAELRRDAETRGVELADYQSDIEGELVRRIGQAQDEGFCGIIINPGAYTHTSVVLLDAVKSVMIPTVEVHISKEDERAAFRQISYIRAGCIATITGKGFDGYLEAIDILMEKRA